MKEAANRSEVIEKSELDPVFNNIEAIYLYHDQFFQDIQKNSRNRPKTLSLVKPVETMVSLQMTRVKCFSIVFSCMSPILKIYIQAQITFSADVYYIYS